jgi:SAM-dependent methyltransferase
VTASVIARVREAYDATGGSWAGAETAYRRMAVAVLAAAPITMKGAKVLDLGAGTGVALGAAMDAGASAGAAVDLADAMLRAGGLVARAVVGDATRLPFVDGAFDLAVAACVLGHLPDPGAALRDLRRVCRAVVASAFVGGWTHPAKTLVDATAVGLGFVPPEWYVHLKAETEPQVDDPDRLAAIAASAGWRRISVTTVDVDTGLTTPQSLAEWRLGMAHLAPWVATLGPAELAELERSAVAALAQAPPLRIPLLVLAGT